MASLETQVRWTDPDGVTQILDDVQKINIRRSEEIKNNNVEVTLQNNAQVERDYVDNNRVVFDPDQDIKVYGIYDDGTATLITDNNLLFDGRVVEFQAQTDSSKTGLKLTNSDSSFILLNKLFVGDEVDSPPQLIIDVINFVNDSVADVSKQVSAALTTSSGFVQATNAAGSTFPDFNVAKVFKPAYDVISELSQPDATGDDTAYRFYIDNSNNFHWFYPDNSATHVIVEGASTAQTKTYTHPVTDETETVTDTNSHKVLNFKLKRAVYDITNFIIYKAGLDLNNDQILDFQYDSTSGSPIIKDSFRNYEDISRELKGREASEGNLTYNSADDYSIAVTSGTTSWGATYSNSTEYNEVFIARCKAKANSRAQAVFNKTGDPRYKGTIELQGANYYDPSEFVLFVSERSGIQAFMRITDVQHNIGKNGWFTTLTVEEEVSLNK